MDSENNKNKENLIENEMSWKKKLAKLPAIILGKLRRDPIRILFLLFCIWAAWQSYLSNNIIALIVFWVLVLLLLFK